jgi:hypothetical protein
LAATPRDHKHRDVHERTDLASRGKRGERQNEGRQVYRRAKRLLDGLGLAYRPDHGQPFDGDEGRQQPDEQDPGRGQVPVEAAHEQGHEQQRQDHRGDRQPELIGVEAVFDHPVGGNGEEREHD